MSAGGGRHGYPLLNAVIEASPRLADTLPHQIYAFAGPFMPAEDFAELQRVAADKSNVILRRYTSRLIDFLHKAELSISFGRLQHHYEFVANRGAIADFALAS